MNFLTYKTRILLILFWSAVQTAAFGQCEVLVWSDEFNGTGLPNSTYWGFDLGAGGWGNSEIQSYTNSTTNVRQENGSLVIEAVKSGSSWSSARVKSQNKNSFKYGKIVFGAKLPTGSGTWPALWMLGNTISTVGWPACGEIDIMEHVGKNQNVVQSALHTPSSFGDTQNKASKSVPTASTAFHEYAISWNATRIIFYIDDVPFYTYGPATKTAANWPFDANQFFIMNIAMGGNLGSDPAFETNGLKNGIDPALTSAKMEIDYVRVYEERTNPLIIGPQFVFENQQGLNYSAPDYGGGVTYTWTLPAGATLLSGQGTKQINVNWGPNDGVIDLVLTGNTGCSVNSTSTNVTTIVEPTGLKYTIQNFSDSNLQGWTKNDNGITYLSGANLLSVNYNISALKYIQYDMPKAVDLSGYGIIKLPVSVASASAIPDLLFTFRDGDGNETISSNFEIKIEKNDGVSYTYSYNFDGLWSLNNPAVNATFIKSLRIYMLSGQSSFQLGPIQVYNSKTIPASPFNLAASTDTPGQVALTWTDSTNATTFNVYRSGTPGAGFTKIKSSIATSESPYIVIPSESHNYYKVSGVNKVGESALTEAIEVTAVVTGIEPFSSLVSIYPNPSNGRFVIQTNGIGVSDIRLFDLAGKARPFDLTVDGQQTIIDLKASSSGVYFVHLNQEGKTRILKVIIL